MVDDSEEDGLARGLLVGKYRDRYGGATSTWERTALPIAVELDSSSGGGT